MPITNLLKAALVVSIGSITGYSVMKFAKESSTSQSRLIASMKPSTTFSKIGQEQVARVLFDLKLETEIAKTEANVSTIKIKIQALKNLSSGLYYSWNIPSGINLLEGPLQHQVGVMQAGEVKYFILKINGFSKEVKKYLSFEIKGNANQLNVRQEVLVSSRLEDSLEYLVQQGEIRKQNDSIDKFGTTKKNKFAPENIIR